MVITFFNGWKKSKTNISRYVEIIANSHFSVQKWICTGTQPRSLIYGPSLPVFTPQWQRLHGPHSLVFGPLQKSSPTLAREQRREFREESEPGIRVGGAGVPEIRNRAVSVPRARSGVWRGPKNTSWGRCPPGCQHRNPSLRSRPRRPAKGQRRWKLISNTAPPFLIGLEWMPDLIP